MLTTVCSVRQEKLQKESQLEFRENPLNLAVISTCTFLRMVLLYNNRKPMVHVHNGRLFMAKISKPFYGIPFTTVKRNGKRCEYPYALKCCKL